MVHEIYDALFENNVNQNIKNIIDKYKKIHITIF